MYHYYVRYSVFSKGKKIGDGTSEYVTSKKITQKKHIEEISNHLKNDVKINFFSETDDLIIDFYQLLRRSFR